MTGMNRALGGGSKVKVLLKGQGEMMLIKNTPARWEAVDIVFLIIVLESSF